MLFPIGSTMWKDFGGGLKLQGQVYLLASTLQQPELRRTDPPRARTLAEPKCHVLLDIVTRVFLRYPRYF